MIWVNVDCEYRDDDFFSSEKQQKESSRMREQHRDDSPIRVTCPAPENVKEKKKVRKTPKKYFEIEPSIKIYVAENFLFGEKYV